MISLNGLVLDNVVTFVISHAENVRRTSYPASPPPAAFVPGHDSVARVTGPEENGFQSRRQVAKSITLDHMSRVGVCSGLV